MLRGVASLLVLCGHLRSFIFVNFGAAANPGMFTKVFYGLTSLGHQSVVIFFAMSGFLVGGKALEDMFAQRWSWSRYLLRRLTRLLIVVVPALVLTGLFDFIGITLTEGRGYDGSLYDIYASGPSLEKPLNYSVTTFLGNVAFLQTIYTPIFGTNAPMWSLANEFWYYVVFPLTTTIFLVPSPIGQRLLTIGFLALCLMFLPSWLLEGGLIWVAGAGAARLTKLSRFTPWLSRHSVRAAALLAVVMTLVISKSNPNMPDLVFGLVVAGGLPAIAFMPSFGDAYRTAARSVAELSYSLYLTHFPFLALIVLTVFAPHQFQPGMLGTMVYAGLFCAAIAWAATVWWCFERNTDRAFDYISARLLPPTLT